MRFLWMAPLLLCTGILSGCDASTQAATASSNSNGDGGAQAAVDPARCQACHQGPLSLDKYAAQDLAQRVEQLRGAPGNHPPLQLEGASGADIEALASALAGP